MFYTVFHIGKSPPIDFTIQIYPSGPFRTIPDPSGPFRTGPDPVRTHSGPVRYRFGPDFLKYCRKFLHRIIMENKNEIRLGSQFSGSPPTMIWFQQERSWEFEIKMNGGCYKPQSWSFPFEPFPDWSVPHRVCPYNLPTVDREIELLTYHPTTGSWTIMGGHFTD